MCVSARVILSRETVLSEVAYHTLTLWSRSPERIARRVFGHPVGQCNQFSPDPQELRTTDHETGPERHHSVRDGVGEIMLCFHILVKVNEGGNRAVGSSHSRYSCDYNTASRVSGFSDSYCIGLTCLQNRSSMTHRCSIT